MTKRPVFLISAEEKSWEELKAQARQALQKFQAAATEPEPESSTD